MGSYNQGLLRPGVLESGVLTSRGLRIGGSYNQGSYKQGFLQPGVLQPGVLTTRGLTTRGSYNQGFLPHGVLTTKMKGFQKKIAYLVCYVSRVWFIFWIYGRLRVLLQTVFSLYIRFTKANTHAQTSKYVYDNFCELEPFCFTCRTKDFSSGDWGESAEVSLFCPDRFLCATQEMDSLYLRC